MIPELAWMLMPLTMLMSQIGGFRWKWVRRIGIPVVIVVAAILWKGWSWWLLAVGPCIWISAILPMTLIGSHIPSTIWNWLWVPVVCILNAFSGFCLIFAYGHWDLFVFGASMQAVAAATLCLLGNIKGWYKFFPWKFFEAVNWMCIGCFGVIGS